MKDKLENLPLFNGQRGKQSYDYDFSLQPDGMMRDVVLTIDKIVLDQIVDHCKSENIEPSELVESLLKLYLEQKADE